MNYQTKVNVVFEGKNNTIQKYVTGFDMKESITCLEFKNEVKSSIKFLDNVEVSSEKLYNGGHEIKDSDLVPMYTSLNYTLTIKQK